MQKTVIAVVSGGLDSATLAFLLAAEGYKLHLISFDYGQRHRKELDCAAALGQRLGARYNCIDITKVGTFLHGSALTDPAINVPDGHYTEPSMAVTIVPNRNAIMLAIAYGIAVAEKATLVGIGVHAGDHAIYPDCRPSFIDAFNTMERYAVEGTGNPDLRLYAPFVDLKKHEIVTIGAQLNVSFQETWSCYKGGALHCGTCGTCIERKEAFALARVPDPTDYEN